MPKFIIQNLKTKEDQEYDIPKDSILFGRINTCDIELPQKSVSRKHAEITQESGDYFITDLKSGNGTFLNQKKVHPLEKNLLRSGDTIRIEDYDIHFLLTEEGHNRPIEEDTDTDIIEIKLIKKMLKALDSDDAPSLEVLNGVALGKKWMFYENQKEVVIGRDSDTNLVIEENVLSRHHAKLERKWGGIVLTDLDSKNGVFINNERIKEKLLRDGDKIMLGTVKLLYRNPKDISLEIINQEINKKKRDAALVEAESLVEKQIEEDKIIKEDQEREQAKQEEEAQEVAQTLEAKNNQEDAISPPPQVAPTGKTRFSLAEKIMIAAGIVVGLIAILGLVLLLK